MSVINLSSEDEDDCVVLDSDHEDSHYKSPKTHKVFIVESIPSYTFNEEEASPKNGSNQLGEQNVSDICIDKINSNENSTLKTQNYNEVSLTSSNKKGSHYSVDLSREFDNHKGHSASPDKISSKIQLGEDFNQLSNQTVDVLTERTESGLENELSCSISQRDKIFSALKLTSSGFQERKCNKPLTDYHTFLMKSKDKENESKRALKILAEELAKVFGNGNHSNVSSGQCNKKNQGTSNMSSVDQTIWKVSKGVFHQRNRHKNKFLDLNTKRRTNKHKMKNTTREQKAIQVRLTKSHKFGSETEVVPLIQTQSSINEFAQTISEANTKVSKVSPQVTECVGKKIIRQPTQSRTTIKKSKRPFKTSKKMEVLKNPCGAKRIIGVLSEPVSAIKSTSLPETKLKKSGKIQVPDSELASINQTNIGRYHDTKVEGLKQQKRSMALKSRKKSTNHTKSFESLPPSKISGPYDNKLKFTFDRSVSVYSVSVVSPSEAPTPYMENISVCLNNIDIPELQNAGNEPQLETLASCDFRWSPIPFCDILNLKDTFVKHYKIIFDDKTDLLCVEMGNSLLQIIKELKNVQNCTQQSNNFLPVSGELKTSAQVCRDVLRQLKRKFIDNFSHIYDQINLKHIIGTQLKTVFLTAWFMKMFLSITTKSPNFINLLDDIKTNTIDILSEEIVRWPLISKTFIKDKDQFEYDCLLVLELIKHCLKDQNEFNFQSNIKSPINKQDHLLNDQQEIIPEMFNDTRIKNNMSSDSIDLEHQTQSNRYPQEVVVSPIQTQSFCKQIQNPYLKEHFSNTKLVNQHSQINHSNTSPTGQKLNDENNQQCVEDQNQSSLDVQQNNKSSAFLKTQIENQDFSNYLLKSSISSQQSAQCVQPILHNHDLSSKYSSNQYHYNTQESSANQKKIAKPTNYFEGHFFPTNSSANNSSKQHFPVRDGGGMEISSCPITIRTPSYSVCDFMGNAGVTINNFNIHQLPPSYIP